MMIATPISCFFLVIVFTASVQSSPLDRNFDNQLSDDVRLPKLNGITRNPPEPSVPQRKFSDIVDALKSLANTRVSKIKHQEEEDSEDSESFNNVIGNDDINNIKWINMDKSDLKLSLDHEDQKPFQIVYDAQRKPIGYIAEAPTSTPKPSLENYYINSILSSLNSKNMIRHSEKNNLQLLKRPVSEISTKTKRIVIKRVPVRTADINPTVQLANALGTPEMQETIIDPVKRTVTTISKYPPYNENEILRNQLRAPTDYFSQYFSPYFPIIIHDPFQSYYDSFSNLIEYGEEADICKGKDNVRQGKDVKSENYESGNDDNEEDGKEMSNQHRRKTRTIHHSHSPRSRRSTYDYLPTAFENDVHESERDNTKSNVKFHIKKPFGNYPPRNKLTAALSKIKENKESSPQTETQENHSGTNISSLKVRRGGVAIAGPGGIATAGSGGTAILGPGQSAYTTTVEGEHNRRSGGVALVGPKHKLLSVSDTQESHLLNLPPGAKLLTTGPIVYMNPVDKTFSDDSSRETVSS